MMRMLKLPIHPFLFGLYPILHLLAQNIAFIPFTDALRSMGFTVAFALFFLMGFRLILKDWQKAGWICTILTFLFFSFGHVANLLGDGLRGLGVTLDIPLFGWIWLVLFVPLPIFVLRAKSLDRSTQLINLIGITLFLFPVFTIVAAGIEKNLLGDVDRQRLSQMRNEAQAEASIPQIDPAERPDIYYIVLDGYERGDMLQEYYQYDNSAFLAALGERGFYVADASRSNYLTTTYSLNTSLNLLYFHEYPAALFKQARYNLYTDYVSEFLRRQGYRIVVFDSGTGDSNFQYADLFVSSPSIQTNDPVVNAFELLLLRTTYALVWFPTGDRGNGGAEGDGLLASSVNRELDVRRERIRYAIDHVPDYAAQEGPSFVFSHITLPHFPFLYGPDGEELGYRENPNLYWYQVDPEHYIEDYGYQLDYLNRAILEMIDSIQVNTKRPLVILLQSDHGDEYYLDWKSPTDVGIQIRSAILNAVYFSDESYADLYPALSPVNNFRIILNHWFGTQYPLLPDKTYSHPHPVDTPYNVIPEFVEQKKP
jgi:hypothetical protein